MLNMNSVLQYIKANLGFPFELVELSDQQIVEYIQENVLKEFSHYVPQKWKIPLNLTLEINKVPQVANEWYIHDPDGLEIYSVIEIYFSGSELYLFGHPPYGPLSPGEVANWALDVETAMTTKTFSSFDYTFEFRHPNILRISPNPTGVRVVTVEYEREQPKDLSGVPNDLQHYLKELALSEIMILVGQIRKRYGGNLRTPFGEIPISSEIYEQGRELKNSIIETLERTALPNVVFDRG